MRVLVCGGRTFSNKPLLYGTLDGLLLKHEQIDGGRHSDFQIVHGGALGADTLAGQWARDNDIEESVFYADWAKHGKAAGPLRNQEMLDATKPDLVVAFPGGRGTADMTRRALLAGVEVRAISLAESEAAS